MLNRKVTFEHLYDSSCLRIVTLTCMSWTFTFSVLIERVFQTLDPISFGLLLADALEISVFNVTGAKD